MNFNLKKIEQKRYDYKDILEVVTVLKRDDDQESITGEELLKAIEYSRRLS